MTMYHEEFGILKLTAKASEMRETESLLELFHSTGEVVGLGVQTVRCASKRA